jgi:N6-L-threonylcarbamoyladenine synthase
MGIILGIESSCDETSASICVNGQILSNIIANQTIHEKFGGVVPELASRAHQQHIVPAVDQAIAEAKIDKNAINAVAFTRGPGLLGSLLVGTSFAKGLALGLNIPLIEVNHMQAHILAHFIEDPKPTFPFICLTVSGGHTQLVLVKDYFDMELLGQTLDDAAGEAFDKSAKILQLPYPGGPLIDRYAQSGNPDAYSFPHPQVGGLNFSFSGLKTAILQFVKKQETREPGYIQAHLPDVCASIQHRIVSILLHRLEQAVMETGITEVAIAGGVSANSGLRSALLQKGEQLGWTVHIPKMAFCTDNAAMIAIAGHYKFEKNVFVGQNVAPLARMSVTG